MMRDESWLQQLLDTTWDTYFSDVPQDNVVRIVFGKCARRQLGSIRRDPKDTSVTIITMNGLFKDPDIPEYVVLATLVHELTHYAHGFNSPLKQRHKHPHAGGVMRKEYAERNLEWLYLDQQKWIKANWNDVLTRHFGTAAPKPRSRKLGKGVPRPFWFIK